MEQIIIDPISLEPIEPEDQITIEEDGHLFIFSCKSLIQNIVISGNTKNPLTRKEFSIDVLLKLESKRRKNMFTLKITNESVKPFDDKRNGILSLDGFLLLGDVIIEVVRWAGLPSDLNRCEIMFINEDDNEEPIFGSCCGDPSILFYTEEDMKKKTDLNVTIRMLNEKIDIQPKFMKFLKDNSKYSGLFSLYNRQDSSSLITSERNLIHLLNNTFDAREMAPSIFATLHQHFFSNDNTEPISEDRMTINIRSWLSFDNSYRANFSSNELPDFH